MNVLSWPPVANRPVCTGHRRFASVKGRNERGRKWSLACELKETAAMTVLVQLLSNTGVEGAKTFAKADVELWARYGYKARRRASPRDATGRT